MIDAAIFYYPTGRSCIQLNITLQYSLHLCQMIVTKHFILPNKNVSKCIIYLHWGRVKLIVNTVFCLKNENKNCRSQMKVLSLKMSMKINKQTEDAYLSTDKMYNIFLLSNSNVSFQLSQCITK